MGNILTFSMITIVILYQIIRKSKSVIESELKEWIKIVILAVSNFMIYCLLQYSVGFITWTIRFHKFQRYPYKNPFCMLVILYCVVSFIILGGCYIKHEKEEYGIGSTLLFLEIIHILAIILVMFLSPVNYFF